MVLVSNPIIEGRKRENIRRVENSNKRWYWRVGNALVGVEHEERCVEKEGHPLPREQE